MNTNGKVNPWTSTYNQGTFIGLANFLDETNDAMLAANFTKDQMRYSGILPSYGLAGNNSGFNAIFLRWLAKFIKDRALQNTFEKWVAENVPGRLGMSGALPMNCRGASGTSRRRTEKSALVGLHSFARSVAGGATDFNWFHWLQPG